MTLKIKGYSSISIWTEKDVEKYYEDRKKEEIQHLLVENLAKILEWPPSLLQTKLLKSKKESITTESTLNMNIFSDFETEHTGFSIPQTFSDEDSE